MSENRAHAWTPITDLPSDWRGLEDPQLHALVSAWKEQAKELQSQELYQEFLEQLRRRWAIETGVLERLYDISEGATKTLIEKGLDAALIGSGDTDKPPQLVVAMISDHKRAIQGLYQFVAEGRPLSLSYIKELHQVITSHQETCDAIDTLGSFVQTQLIRGAWKRLPNNIQFDDGSKFEFCPPEHVEGEMQRLVEWHAEHEDCGISPEVQAAWLHHRFTLIHPFQDGNGRVARCLATLILLRNHWFPLVVTRDDRVTYLESLRRADKGDLSPLIELIGTLQRRAIRSALSLGESVIETKQALQDVLQSIDQAVTRRKTELEKRFSAVLTIGDALQSSAYHRLQDVVPLLDTKLKRIDPQFKAFATSAPRNDPRKDFNYFQIVQCAKMLGYFANLDVYRAWTALVLSEVVRTEILFSLHGIGRDSRGILVCTGMTYQKQTVNEDNAKETRIGEVVPLSAEPFELTYRDKPIQIERAFQKWLEACLVKGLQLFGQDL